MLDKIWKAILNRHFRVAKEVTTLGLDEKLVFDRNGYSMTTNVCNDDQAN